MATLITVATSWEVYPFLKKRFKNHLPGDYPIELGNGRFLIVTGMGKKNVKRCLEKITLDFSQIINIGVAGSLDSSLPIGKIYRVDKICSQGKIIKFKPYLNSFLSSLELAEMETHNLPFLWAPKKKARRLVDMEGASLAECYPDLPHAFIKIVFDYCSLTSLITSLILHRAIAQKSLIKAFEGIMR